jgi:hypothetical protein
MRLTGAACPWEERVLEAAPGASMTTLRPGYEHDRDPAREAEDRRRASFIAYGASCVGLLAFAVLLLV